MADDSSQRPAMSRAATADAQALAEVQRLQQEVTVSTASERATSYAELNLAEGPAINVGEADVPGPSRIPVPTLALQEAPPICRPLVLSARRDFRGGRCIDANRSDSSENFHRDLRSEI